MENGEKLRELGPCIVEVLGRRTLIGEVREEILFGERVCRVDVTGKDGEIQTSFFSPRSLFSLTPVDAAAAESAKLQLEKLTLIGRFSLPPAAAQEEDTAATSSEWDADGEEDGIPF